MKNTILIFLKGLLMGICDLIPGISGGTIAFITGIYQRLIDAVKSFNLRLLKSIFVGSKYERRASIQKLDLRFLITLITGIVVAILLGSRLIKFLLETHFSFTLAFFIGLILASSKIIFNHIQNHKLKNIFFGLIGFLIGIAFVFLVPINIEPGLGYTFLGGFFAISAMFLPGISGAFILLILGLYEFMINVLHDISGNLSFLIVFILGAILGAMVISRVISWLFEKDKCKTLYFLLGLVIGALGIPIKRIIQETSFTTSNTIFIIVFLIIGIVLVSFVGRFRKKLEKGLDDVESRF